MILRRTILAALLAAPLGGAASAEPPRPSDGLVTAQQARAYFAGWDTAVWAEAFGAAGPSARQFTPCAKGMTEAAARAAWGVPESQPFALDRLRLVAPALDLPPRHDGDVGCALIEGGFWPLFLKSSGEGRLAITFLQEGRREVVVEVESADPIDAAEITIDAVSLIKAERGGRPIVLRPRPASAADLVGSREAEVRDLAAEESLGALRAMAGLGAFDLAAASIETRASRAAEARAVSAEPGCAETGACPVPSCGPARRDNDLLRAALFPPEEKVPICETLANWRTERHPPAPPDARLVRRALILALQDATPEADRTDGFARVVVEHSLSGTRFIAFSPLGASLFTIPLQAQTVREVEVDGCRGSGSRMTCDASVEVELFSRAVNMPESVQKALLEAMLGPPRTYSRDLTFDFERRDARWRLTDPEAVVSGVLDWSGALIEKGPVDYFIEDVNRLRGR